MNREEATEGVLITNGSSALKLHHREERDPFWKTSGWRGVNIPLERFGGNPNTLGFVPDYLLSSWRPVPEEWTPVGTADGLEERYVWRDGYRWLGREVRRADDERARWRAAQDQVSAVNDRPQD